MSTSTATLLCDFKVKDIAIQKWVSNRTGITVYSMQSAGPMVNGYAFLRTETMSHDGCPHTLEHLIFLGSEDYPYKVLDLIASKSFADGTNAWTATDHTAYTLKTAGSEGFLQAFPILLDHVLYPTLTQEGFHTEVHHINGEGKNSGVVYAEMQEVENRSYTKIAEAANDIIFPGKCAYQSETGGKLADLRTLTNETVRAYHKSFYRPDNLAILVVGQVTPDEIFKAIDPIETKIISKGVLPPMQRPFTTPVALFTESGSAEVVYPSEDETIGNLMIHFKGPAYQNFDLRDTFILLLEYLVDGPSSPGMYFSNCPVERIRDIKDKYLEVLRGIVENKDFDLERMRSIVEKARQNSLLALDKSFEKQAEDHVVLDFLYSQEASNDLELIFDVERIFNVLSTKDEAFWLDMIETHLLPGPFSVVAGIPSTAESERLTQDELKRTEAQIQELGQEKLKELGDLLVHSQAINNRTIDQALLDNITIPSVESISFYPLVTVYNDKPTQDDAAHEKLASHIQTSIKLPFNSLFDYSPSLCFQITILLNTRNVAQELRPYLSLYTQLVYFHRCTKDKYEQSVDLICSLLRDLVFDVERIKIMTQQMLDAIPEVRNDGTSLMSLLNTYAAYDRQNSNSVVNDGCQLQQLFLTKLLEMIATPEGAAEVIANLSTLRDTIIHPSAFVVQVSGDLYALDNVKQPWINGFEGVQSSETHLEPMPQSDVLSESFRNQCGSAHIIALPGSGSSFFQRSINSTFSHDNTLTIDYAALLLATNYYSQMEGPLWKAVRGAGYAYSIYFNISPENGILGFICSRSSNPQKAFEESRRVVLESIDQEVNSDWFQSARSTTVFSLVQKEPNIYSAFNQSLWSHAVRRWPKGGYKDLIKMLYQVDQAKMMEVVRKYIVPVFDDAKSNTSFVTDTPNVESIQQLFPDNFMKLVTCEAHFV
eukprot:gene12397-14549_t